MSMHYGTFSVQNNTGAQITSVVVQHRTTDHGSSHITVPSLANGATQGGGKVVTSTSNKDRWSVSFMDSSGQLRTGHENCGFESEDEGGNVLVVLNVSNFSINMPKSSSCDDNGYSD